MDRRQMTEQMDSDAVGALAGKRVGVAILANDGIYDWLLPFLDSFRQHNPSLAVYLIPFDNDMAKTIRAAREYGVSVVEDDFTEIDRFARRIYPFYRQRYRRRLRKFYSLSLPLDEVMYIDVDTLVYRDLSKLFGRVESGRNDFIIASTSDEWVYTAKINKYPRLAEAVRFSDGFFITSSQILSLGSMIDIVDGQLPMFHDVRRTHVYTQPVVNFVVHQLDLRISSLTDLLPEASCETFYRAQGIKFTADGPLDADGRDIYFAHWAGVKDLPAYGVFDRDWQAHSARAIARLR